MTVRRTVGTAVSYTLPAGGGFLPFFKAASQMSGCARAGSNPPPPAEGAAQGPGQNRGSPPGCEGTVCLCVLCLVTGGDLNQCDGDPAI